MGSEEEKRPVVVAVDRPDRAAQLVRTASDIAALQGVPVRVITVVVKPPDSPFGVFEDATIIERYASDSRAILSEATAVAPGGVEVEGELVIGTSVSNGIVSAVERLNPSAVVIGWHERTRREALLGTTVDRLVRRLPCDLFVERIGTEADGVSSVLLPVAGGPHLRPAATAAKAIAVRNDASLSILSVVGPDMDASESESAVEEAALMIESLPGPSIQFEATVTESEPVLDIVLDAVEAHDVTIFGATRQGALRRRIVGSLPRRVAAETDRTVLLGRAGDVVADRPRGLKRIWAAMTSHQ